MSVATCADCQQPMNGGKLTERGMVCASCFTTPTDPRVDHRGLQASRNDRLSRLRERDQRQGKPV